MICKIMYVVPFEGLGIFIFTMIKGKLNWKKGALSQTGSPLDNCALTFPTWAQNKNAGAGWSTPGVLPQTGPRLQRAAQDSREDAPSLKLCPAMLAPHHWWSGDLPSLTWLLSWNLACHQDHADGTSPGSASWQAGTSTLLPPASLGRSPRLPCLSLLLPRASLL